MTRAHTEPADPPPTALRQRGWPQVTATQWDDWRWQRANQIRTTEQLGTLVALSAEERRACARAAALFPMGITPYYASLINPDDPSDPIRRQCVPRAEELAVAADELDDPLAEDSHMPTPSLTHRYPDRALLYATHDCPVYCRHCNRRRKVGQAKSAATRAELDAGVAYVTEHPEVRDVLVSGGDPLSLSNRRLLALLRSLRRIAHLEIIRVATRAPATLPQRVTPTLARLLREVHPIFVSTHFNHVAECTPQAQRALNRLADAGCVLSNQMVLLKGVNDDPQMVRRLNQWLLAQRCRPYYIFQCDAARGISHFRTPVASGLDILEALRGWTSGLAVPHYVVDLPGGGGKVPLQPQYLLGRDGQQLTFRSFKGDVFVYEDGRE